MDRTNSNRAVKTVKRASPMLVMPDKHMKEHLSAPWHFKIETSIKQNKKHGAVFLVLSLSMLDDKVCKQLNLFDAVFVQADINTNAIFDKINSKQVRSKIYLFDKWQELNRILYAWLDGAQDVTIATAWVENDQLIIKDCALKQYRIAFNMLPELNDISVNHRSKFKIHQFGNYLYWPNEDMHLDLDIIRYHCDKKYKRAKDLEAFTYYKNYGQAITFFRKQQRLTQKQIEQSAGLSARQLYRIESGQQKPTLKLLEKLAKAHKLPVNDYLSGIADACHFLLQHSS